MKLIIDIPEEVVKAIQDGEDYRYDIHTAIAQGKPYDTSGDLISREALKKQFANECLHNCYYCKLAKWDKEGTCYNCGLIDNAQTVDCSNELGEMTFSHALTTEERHDLTRAFLIGKRSEQRPQGECKSCRHRDPEDKKCDCGDLERQGCPFPVSDDYYCKYYERGKEE